MFARLYRSRLSLRRCRDTRARVFRVIGRWTDTRSQRSSRSAETFWPAPHAGLIHGVGLTTWAHETQKPLSPDRQATRLRRRDETRSLLSSDTRVGPNVQWHASLVPCTGWRALGNAPRGKRTLGASSYGLAALASGVIRHFGVPRFGGPAWDSASSAQRAHLSANLLHVTLLSLSGVARAICRHSRACRRNSSTAFIGSLLGNIGFLL